MTDPANTWVDENGVVRLAGTVTGAIESGGTASGDLSGTYPGPTVAKVNGITVTGTPTAGDVLTASSASAASWAGGSQPLQSVTVGPISNATIKQLPLGSAVEIVPAQGANKVALPVVAFFVANFAVAYSGQDADGSYLGVDGLASFQNIVAAGDSSLTGFLTATNVADGKWLLTAYKQENVRGAAVATAYTAPGAQAFTAGSFANTPLYLGAGNSVNFGGGDAANTLTVTVLYSVVTV